jgi:hypothetical protein
MKKKFCVKPNDQDEVVAKKENCSITVMCVLARSGPVYFSFMDKETGQEDEGSLYPKGSPG